MSRVVRIGPSTDRATHPDAGGDEAAASDGAAQSPNGAAGARRRRRSGKGKGKGDGRGRGRGKGKGKVGRG